MQQVFEDEESRLLVLDTLCILCQDLRSQVEQGESDDGNFESLVAHCRKQYLEFKQMTDSKRKKDEQEAEEEMQEHESHSVLT